nr:aminotransferase class IV [Hymenobacter pini]
MLYNDHLLPEADFSLPLPNRGLFFNDGFFETMVWSAGQLRYAPHHLARMQRAAAALALELPAAVATTETLTTTVQRLISTCPPSPTGHRLRLQLWRSGGGLYTPGTTRADWLLTRQAFVEASASLLHVGFAHTIQTQVSPVSFCKGPNALTYVLAAQERQQRGLDELVLISSAGHVAETVAAAVAWVRGTTVYTPAEGTGCVAGTRLAHLRDTATQAGFGWEAGLFEPSALLEAEAVFTANIAGIHPILRLDDTIFASDDHSVVQRLRELER